jgi:tetrahydromethanopterin S-methyltransferase subunit G
MMNDRVTAYLQAVANNLAHLPTEEREATMREMRSHLHDEIAELRRSDPGMGEIEATERALRAFGDPTEIGVSFGASGTKEVVNRRTGEVLVRVARMTGRVAIATGRGIGRTVKWILVLVFGIALLAIGSALTLLIVFQDDLREAAPRPIHTYARDLDDETSARNTTFFVNPDVKEIRIHLNVDRAGTQGCAAVTVRNPAGVSVFDTTGDCSDVRTLLTFYDEGRWTVSYEFTSFTGWIDLDVYAFERVR